jgi:hypothetical protein
VDLFTLFSEKGNMQDPKQRVKTGLIAFAVLIMAAIIIFLFRERHPFGTRNTSFAINPEIDITAIELSKDTENVVLSKKEDGWLVNNKYEVRKSAVLSILKLLRAIEIKSPVTKNYFDHEILAKGLAPVKVKVFHGKRIVRSFFVYRTTSNIYGNIMKMKSSSKPYIVFMPGLDADLGSFFSTDELFWQPYVLFNLLPSEISVITVENPAEPESSFSVTNKGHHITLGDRNGALTGWDTSRVLRYISYFTHVPFEAPVSGTVPGEQDSIEKKSPLYQITIERKDGKKIVLILWQRWLEKDGTKEKDTDRLWAKISDREGLFIVKYMDIDPILKKISYFFTG